MRESGAEFRARARVVVNAAGPFCDEVRRMADPATPPLLAASRGSHVVLDRSFLPGESALLIPETPDGRVLFAIPWHGHTLVGTTDVEIPSAPVEPRASEEEIDFILETAGRYLARKPGARRCALHLRGRAAAGEGIGQHRAVVARLRASASMQPGLITITGGKWTTYRSMAEACVDRASRLAGLPKRPCVTRHLRIHGYEAAATGPLAVYGSDAAEVQRIAASRPVTGRDRSTPPCPTPARRSSGPRGPRWHARSRTFSPGGRGRSS